MTSVVLQETLSAAGMYSHISDMNSKYKHNAENIQYTETNENSVNVMSIGDKIRQLASQITPSQNYDQDIDAIYSAIQVLEQRVSALEG